MTHELVLILDFGSQYTQLIARRTRALGIYSEIVPFNVSYEDVINKKPKALILSGSPYSVSSSEAPIPDEKILNMNIPILGICFGMQLLCHLNGGKIIRSPKKEYGFASITIDDHKTIFKDLSPKENVWMSHGDAVAELPPMFKKIAHSDNSPFAAIKHIDKPIFALQFHPEVVNTINGTKMISNFLIDIAKFKQEWTSESFVENSIEELKEKIGDKKVILGLSGGVDSSVAAALLYKAIGNRLIPILVDTGLLRKDEVKEVEYIFKVAFGLDLDVVDAKDIFIDALKDVFEPEKKRKIIGHKFVEIFEKEAKKFKDAEFLAQGTLYPDVIESVSFKGPSQTIKTHHNVGGLPERMNLKLIEPLRELFKDDVRKAGIELGLPAKMVNRHPFPGPGLAIRIISDVTREKIKILQEVDSIFIEELHESKLYNATWQAFAVLLPVQSVGVMGDERTYENVCALRAVTSVDGMTADWAELPFWFLKRVSNRIINEVNGINRVVYDISSKPPSTIEWE